MHCLFYTGARSTFSIQLVRKGARPGQDWPPKVVTYPCGNVTHVCMCAHMCQKSTVRTEHPFMTEKESLGKLETEESFLNMMKVSTIHHTCDTL